MIDAACNFLNPYSSASLAASANLLGAELHTGTPVTTPVSSTTSSSLASSAIAVAALSTSANGSICNNLCSGSGIGIGISGSSAPALPTLPASGSHALMKLEMQYPPQAPSAGSTSPNSSLSLSASTSASVSPGIFPSPAQSFASISSSPPASALSASPLSGSPTASHQHADIAAAAYWGNTYSAALPTRTQFPYASYAPDYYGNVAMPAGAAWFSHQDRLYQSPWSAAAAGQTYASFNFDDIAFQTQLQRRSVRCTCPNCTNEMSGLPPIVGPDERGRKQHICHIPGCERLYGKASHLKTHLRWHTGERPFLCLTCGKRFSRSDELQRHGRTHTNYRPYACPICSKKFSRSDHLSKHKKTHFKDKKSKKALAAEAKGQTTAIKLEKSEVEKSHNVAVDSNNNNSKPSINSRSSVASSAIGAAAAKTSTTAATSSNAAMATSLAMSTVKSTTTSSSVSSLSDITMQLKTEKPELPSSYNIYNSMYHQNSSLFHARSHAHLSSAAATAAAYNNLHPNSQQQQHQHQSVSSSSTSSSSTSVAPSFDLWSSHHHHHYHQQQQHHLSRGNVEQTEANISTSVPNAVREQQQHSQQQQQLLQQHHQHQQLQQQQQTHNNHYAALARQSESQLAAEYGFTISGGSDGSSAGTPVHRFQHSSNTSSYPGLISHMKSEYPAYPDLTSNSAYMTTSSAFHHHPHSHNHPWTTATVYPTSHATA